MNFDNKLKKDNMIIFYSNGLTEFVNDFIDYYDNNIQSIMKNLKINIKDEIIIALTNDKKIANVIYEDTGFSGFFTDTGAFAYINMNGKRSVDYMKKGIMHELVHYYYKNYVYGSDKERITWVDEGLAQLLSNQKEELNDKEKYIEFLNQNVDNVNLNELNHEDKSFGEKNGYNLSYIAVRYLYESNTHSDFISIIKDEKKLRELGFGILNKAFLSYGIENKKVLK